MKNLALFALVLVAACGGKSTPATTDPHNGGGEPSADEPRMVGPFTLTELQQGDASCNVLYTAADGTAAGYDGDFEVCPGGGKDATPLIGQQVMMKLEKGNILAGECEGDMDCGKSDTVDLVVEITAAP